METTLTSEIRLDRLDVRYPGGVHALKSVTLQIGHGLFGLLGPNGAGKTTLMRTLATLHPPTAGRVFVFGQDVVNDSRSVRKLLGYLPQDFQTYPQLRAWEALDYYAILNGFVARPQRRERIGRLLVQVGLTEFASRKVGALSGGMLRRLGVAQALLNDPRLLILDEPTAGLDPAERINFRNMLTELSRDRVVLLSTHIVSDIGSACEKLAVIDRGELRFIGNRQALLDAANSKVWHVTASDSQCAAIRSKYPVTSIVETRRGLDLKVLAAAPEESHWQTAEPNLEDAYLWLLKGSAHGN